MTSPNRLGCASGREVSSAESIRGRFRTSLAFIRTNLGHSLTRRFPAWYGAFVNGFTESSLCQSLNIPTCRSSCCCIAAVGFALTPLALAWLWAKKFSPHKPGQDKNAIYECGLESKGDAWVQFKSEYYLYAIIFLIFDVETIFLLPFAVAFTRLDRRRVHRDDGFSAAAGRRSGLGLAERGADLEMKQLDRTE